MAHTQTPRRQPRPLHVEPLENRWLPAGQHALPLAPVALVADPGLPALVSAPLTADNQAMPADASGPGTDNPPDGGGAQAAAGDGSSRNGDASGLSQGDLSQGASDESAGAGAGGDTSATSDASTGQSQASTGTLGLEGTQTIQDAIVTDNTTLDQTVVLTSGQDLTITSITLGTGNQNNQQGDDSGSGNNGGGDSGSTGDGSDTTDDQTTGTNGNTDDQTGSGTTTQDVGTTDAGGQTTGTNDTTARDAGTTATSGQTIITPGNTSNTDANAHHPTAVTGHMGPDPAPASSGQPGGEDAAGKNPPANAGESQPPASTDPMMAAPKPPEDAAPRLPLTLSPADGPKATQKTLGGTEYLPGLADSTRVPDPHEAGEANTDKRTDGVKGNFSVPDAPPAAEPEGTIVRAEDGSPRSDALVAESMEAPAPARAVPPTGSVLLAAAMPFDLPALERGVAGFFAQLDQVSEQILPAPYRAGLGPWLVALATAGVALEATRRKLRAAPGGPACAEGDVEPTWSWLVTPVDELAPEPG